VSIKLGYMEKKIILALEQSSHGRSSIANLIRDIESDAINEYPFKIKSVKQSVCRAVRSLEKKGLVRMEKIIILAI